MWETYKKEISEKEKEQKDFLRNYYRHSLRIHLGNSTDGEKKEEISAEVVNNSNQVKTLYKEKLTLKVRRPEHNLYTRLF